MKKCILTVLGAIAALSLPVSCSDEFGGNEGAGNGRISPVVDLNTETVTSRSTSPESRAAASRATEVTVADLSLRLTKNDGSFSGEWPIAEFPIENAFTVGDYTLEAFYGDPTEQGFDLPAYSGSQTITVRDGETATPEITATLANSMVTIKYTDAFTGYMADYGASVNGIEYGKEEERAVYVTPGDVEIKVNVKKPNGIGAEFTLDKVDALPRHHYTVTIDLNNGGAGDAQLNVSFDDMMDTEEVNIDLSDKVLSSPAPVVNPKGFESENTIDVVTGMPSDLDMSMNLIARAGLRNVTLKTVSASLVGQGWPEEIDLMAADGSTQAKLTGLGLEVVGLWKTPGEMAVINFSDVVKYIKTVAGDDNITEFTVTVKDKLMRESDPVTLRLNVEDVMMDLTAVTQFFEPGASLDVTLGFNGPGTYIKDNIKIEYKNPIANVWRELGITSVSEGRSRAMLNYTISVTAPIIEDALTLRATYGNSHSNEITIDMAPFEINFESTDIYATSAFVKVVPTGDNPAPSTDNMTFLAQKDGEDDFNTVAHTVTGNFAKVTGLAPDTNYKLKVRINGMGSKVVNFRTETAPQLENADLEEWTETAGASDHWSVFSLAGWSTLNKLTTSEGGAYGRNLLQQINNNKGAGYVAKSGTQRTSESVSGYAALIQTVGWGGNNGTGYNATVGLTRISYPLRCDNITPGELYLGSYDEDTKNPVYGMYFNSRPSALKFQYKYEPKNESDWGIAKIALFDTNGDVIAQKEVNLTASESYTASTLELPLVPGLKKAAKLQVIFKSSGNEECLVFNDTNFSYPSSSVLSTADGMIGSKLYVDDIQLIY